MVSAATRENMTLICSVLNCPTTYERSFALMNDAFESYNNECLLRADEVFLIQSGNRTIQAVSGKDIYYPLLKEEKELIEICTKPAKIVPKGKKTSEIVGQFEIYLAKQLLFSGNLYKL